MAWERRKRDPNIMFAVNYDNGRTAYITVSPKQLERGEHVVRELVRERQDSGEIPAGQVASVRRVR
ncbi:MAG TPA: hypothetical protein VH743_10925 [Beijerinckiaceae bacterium]|jgi:hypothetical protein